MICKNCGYDTAYCRCGTKTEISLSTASSFSPKTQVSLAQKAKAAPSQPKTPQKKKWKRILAVICAAAVLLGAGTGVWFWLNTPQEEAIAIVAPPFVCLPDGFEPSFAVTDTATAIGAISSVSDVTGVKNPAEELKEVSVHTMGNSTYYRLQQYYKGLPVFARQMILSADKNGKVNSLTSNYLTIQQDIDTTPTATLQAMNTALKDYLGRNETITKDTPKDLIIYPKEDGQILLAYLVSMNGSRYIFDAKTGEVLNYLAAFYGASASCTYPRDGDPATGMFQGIKEDKVYLFADEEKGIYLLDAKAKTTTKSKENSSQRDTIPNVAQPMTSKNTNFNGGADDSFSKKDAIKAGKWMEEVEKTQAYFRKLNENQLTDTFIVINIGDDKTGAYGGCLKASEVSDYFGLGDRDVVTVLTGKDFVLDKNSYDVLGHEFTHAVSRSLGAFIYSGSWTENGALNEAYSDIFGELYEAHISGKAPDWKHADRNMAIPQADGSLYPAHYAHVTNAATFENGGLGYYTTTEMTQERSTRFTHFACVLISHAAYRMWNGVDGTKELKIGLEDMAELWYRSLLLMLPDADFSECRNAVELAAKEMNKAGKLTAQQVWCVTKSFETVGVDSPLYNYSKRLKETFTLKVYNYKGKALSTNYDVVIKDYFTGNEVYRKTLRAAEVTLSLKKGPYTMTLTNKGTTEQVYSVQIYVDGSVENADGTLSLYTNFNDLLAVPLDPTNKNTSTTTSTKKATTTKRTTKPTQAKPDTSSNLSFKAKRQLEKQLYHMNIIETITGGCEGPNRLIAFSTYSFDDLMWYICNAKVNHGLYNLYRKNTTWDDSLNDGINEDPLHRYEAHTCLDEDLTHWIATHLFPTSAQSSFSGKNFYTYNGKVYFYGCPNAGLMGVHTYTVTKHKKLTNGRYLVTVQYECRDDEDQTLLDQCTMEVEAALETDPTYGDYWRMYTVEWVE